MLGRSPDIGGLSARDQGMAGIESQQHDARVGMGEKERSLGPRHSLALQRRDARRQREEIMTWKDLTWGDQLLLKRLDELKLDEPIFTPDEGVRVKRSGGTIEDGWHVFNPLTQEGRVIVRKQGVSGVMEKNISELELAALNPGDEAPITETLGGPVRQFKIGERVRVRRSDGTIEDGWEVVNPRTESGRVLVVRVIEKDRDFIRKAVRPEELTELNPSSEA